jgi:hypothetical protein
MARYVREPGEVELLKELVDPIRGDQRVHGMLILTDRRLVLQSVRPSPTLRWLFRWFAPIFILLGAANELGPLEMTHQIDRDDFDAVEAQGRQTISFHSKGEGYGHISFAVYSMTPFDVWQHRMQAWVAGALSAPPGIPARPVER